MHNLAARLTLPLLLAGVALAQAPQRAPAGLTFPEHRGVSIDSQIAGTLWVRGETYKARFDAGGVRFLPLFGGATRHTPFDLRFRAERSLPVEPTGQGMRVTYRQGDALTEQWNLLPRGIEQTFVLARPPAIGSEFVLRIDVDTELAFSGHRAGKGLEFQAEGLGTVTYGDGVVFDAAGARLAFASVYENGVITLRVPAAFLAHATYPVTIDPLVSTTSIAARSISEVNPDVATDPGSGEFMVVVEEILNASDHDIRAFRFAADGTLLDGSVYYESGTDLCITPHIANFPGSRRYAVVWDNESTGVQARLHAPPAAPLGVAQVTSDGVGVDTQQPDVGCFAAPTTQSIAMVVFVRRSAGVNYSLNARAVDGVFGQPFGSEFLVENAPGCDPRPDISPRAGITSINTGHWLVVWQKKTALCNGGDIWFAALNQGGVLAAPAPLEDGPEDEVLPRVVTSGADSQVVWQEDNNAGNISTVHLRRSLTGNTFSQIGAKFCLSCIEPGVNRADRQVGPAIAFDGCRHSYLYLEGPPAQQSPKAACMFVEPGTILFSEGHVALSTNPRAHGSLAIDHVDGTRHAVVWHELTSAGDFDVRAAFYEGRSPTGGVTVVPTHCGRTRIDIVATQPPTVGHPFAVDLVGFSGAPVLLVGAPTTPIPLCVAVPNPCALGVSPIVLNILGTRFATTVPCQSGLVNGALAFQGVDVNVIGGCSFAGAPLRTTDTLVVSFQ